MTVSIWPTKPEIVTVWPFTENGTHIVYTKQYDGSTKMINVTRLLNLWKFYLMESN